MVLKVQFRGSNLRTGCQIHLKISGQIEIDLLNNFNYVRFA